MAPFTRGLRGDGTELDVPLAQPTIQTYSLYDLFAVVVHEGGAFTGFSLVSLFFTTFHWFFVGVPLKHCFVTRFSLVFHWFVTRFSLVFHENLRLRLHEGGAYGGHYHAYIRDVADEAPLRISYQMAAFLSRFHQNRCVLVDSG